MKLFTITALLALSVLCGCAHTSMLPKSAAEVPFDTGREGKVGWSSYREKALFRSTSVQRVYEAAKAGLGDAGFALRRADLPSGVVIGEHGMTWHDWNVLAGVYFRQAGPDVQTAVLVEGSKDIGFSGDVTSGAWTGQILKGMRQYLAE